MSPSKPRSLAGIGGEAALIAGGGRAILLQLAHPAVGHGVANHSDFVSRPLDRLHSTMTFVYAVVDGDPGLVDRVARAVNATHRRVRSPGDEGTPSYNAADPTLQLWVAATLYDTAIRLYERLFGVLPPEQADEIYRQYALLGTTLQMPADLWPADREAFGRYWTEMAGTLRTDAVTRDVAQKLLHPANVPVWVKAGMPLARLLTAGLLNSEQRAMFELPWSPRRQRRFDVLMRAAAAVYPRLPRRLRRAPMRRYLAKLRENREPTAL
ncbi:MAG: oxygenase MpaB family protein [Microbacteriaceae bacterium]